MSAGGIEIAGLTVRYDPTGGDVLSGLDLIIEAGTFVTLLGPSGCGKSTLLNCIAGFIRPVRGRLSFDDAIVTGPSRQRGMVFQRDELFPWISIAGNIGFALRAARFPRAQRRERVATLLAAVELPPDVARKLPHELSGGMRQRVGIARALANNPPVLLMDEPFGALDAQTRSQMQDLIIGLWEKTGTTIVFVTHDVDEAVRVSSSIVVMDARGSIVERITNPLPRPRPTGRLAEFAAYPHLRRTLHELLSSPQATLES